MKKVLITDDELEIVEFLSTFLKRRNVQVVIATSGGQALDIFRRQPPDLMLLDIDMPDMNGLKILEIVKSENKRTKVIMVTGKDDKVSISKATKLGAEGYITKPLELSELYSVVAKHLITDEG
ncbi:MAG: response regulator [Candidatus Omnitrophica bacterium]|nr:response regulator [Candidatus Omnitrophota bacterium]